MPGKLFEYLIAEKPILGLIGKSSVAAGVLKESGIGFLADADNVEETAEQIEHQYKLRDNKTLKMEPNHEFIEQFNCHGLVKRLASVLELVSFRNS